MNFTRKEPPSGASTSKGLPPCSRATSTSWSVIALAIQIASRWDARPVRAVTRPPVPRLTEPSSWKVTGPRFETRTSWDWESEDIVEDPQVVSKVAGREEVRAHVLLAVPT